MKFFWLIPFFLLQDTEAFLMKNAKVKLCLQASPMNGNLLLEDCNPESDFQDWSWQGDSLMNHGTQSCLSVVGANRVQTSLCGSVDYTSWDCLKSVLSPLGSSQGFLVANRKGVALNNVRGLRAQWQDAADKSVCEEKAAEAEQDRYFPAALASTRMYDHTAGNVTLALGIDQEELEELLWFFRREDRWREHIDMSSAPRITFKATQMKDGASATICAAHPSRCSKAKSTCPECSSASTWNYSILALSFVSMILGLLLLAINVVRNRQRKIHMYREGVQTTQQAELEAKQALMPVQEYSPAEPQKQELVPQDQRSGEVVVQWKDGTVTSLYTEASEHAI